jgi:hypothetical protein
MVHGRESGRAECLGPPTEASTDRVATDERVIAELINRDGFAATYSGDAPKLCDYLPLGP